MTKQPLQPGTAVLDILVERHRSLLRSRGEPTTPEQALGRLVAVYLRFSRDRLRAAFAEALREAETLAGSPRHQDHLPKTAHAPAT